MFLWRTCPGAPQNLARSASGQSLRVGPANILWRTWAGAPQKPLFLWRTLLGAPQKYVFLWRMGKSCATERQKILWRTLLHAPQKYFCGAPLNGAPQNVNLPITLFLVVNPRYNHSASLANRGLARMATRVMIPVMPHRSSSSPSTRSWARTHRWHFCALKT